LFDQFQYSLNSDNFNSTLHEDFLEYTPYDTHCGEISAIGE